MDNSNEKRNLLSQQYRKKKSIRVNYNNVKIEKKHFCEEKDGTVNIILSEYIKLARVEYKSRCDRVGTVIHWEIFKRRGFGHIKRYQNKAEVVGQKKKVPY